MKIVRLEAENVKRLRVVSIAPGPDGLVVIRGENGQGKSSVLDSIAYALGGKSLQPPKVIRAGEEEAHVLLELDDLLVERRWTASGSKLEVKSKDGAKYSSPQAMLDKLTGQLSFDPLAFMRQEPRAQVDALRELAGLDFTALDAQRSDVFAKRTHANKLLADLQAQARALESVPATEPVDVAALLVELDQLQDQERAAGDAQRQIEHAAATLKAHRTEVERAQQTVAELEERLAKAREILQAQERCVVNAEAAVRAAEEAAAAAPVVGPDLVRVREQLQTAEATNAAARKYQQRLELEARIEKGKATVASMTEKIEGFDQQKADQLAAARFPVDGLSFTEDGPTLNGLPLEQASSAEQLRVSVAMGIAFNPKLRVLLIRDGSLLDANSLRMVGELAEAAGAQVWIEIVGKDGMGVVIEDGAVVSVDGEAAGAPPPGLELEPPPAPKKGRGRKADAT